MKAAACNKPLKVSKILRLKFRPAHSGTSRHLYTCTFFRVAALTRPSDESSASMKTRNSPFFPHNLSSK